MLLLTVLLAAAFRFVNSLFRGWYSRRTVAPRIHRELRIDDLSVSVQIVAGRDNFAEAAL